MTRAKTGMLGGAALAAMIWPALAAAQSPEPAAPVDTTEIIVTAQKRAENLQRVPIVISVVSAAQIQSSGITGLTTLATVTPGLTSRTSGGAVFQPSLRGIGTSSNVVENPVALYIDGVYLPQQREGNRELLDVEQVAVLKGPQGTLFGRNATGGVIQITTRRPTQDFGFRGRAEIDTYSTFRGSAFVTGGLTTGVSASVSVDYAKQGEGWGRNRTSGNDTFKIDHAFSVRGKLLFEPGPDTSITLIGDYMNRKDFTYTFVPYPGTSLSVPAAGPVTGKQDTYSPIDTYAAFNGGGVSLTAEHDFGFARFVSITALRRNNSDYLFDDVPTGTPAFYVGVARDAAPNRTFSQEVQLISRGGPFTYTVGAFYFYNRNSNLPILRQFFPAFYGNPPAAALANLNRITQTYGGETTRSFAPFGQVAVALGGATTLTLGARYTYEKRELVGLVVLTRYGGTVITTPFNPAPLTIRQPTWRIALDHQFTPDVLGYVSYNRGIKSGGFNILNPANPAYLPERLDAYEAGLKTQLFDRKLRLNVGGFYYDYNNVQVTQFVNLAQSVVNGAKARLYGVDVDFGARLTPELRVSGGFELLSAKFTSYPNAVSSIPRATGGATLIVADATGNRIPQSQKFAGSIAVDYEQLVSFGTILFNTTANFNGDYKIEADNFLTQGAFTLLNASLGWRTSDSRLTLSVFTRNLLDAKVINNATTQAVGYPTSYGGQAPRTFGVSARVTL